ncbi:MAG: hypothetical protein KA438_04620 [Aliarcobacter sp.]|nr:hypothetical protein [Aliarcobacter sp.]
MTATINSKYRSLDYISKKIKKFPNFEEYLNSITVNTAKNYKLPIEEYIDTISDIKLKAQHKKLFNKKITNIFGDDFKETDEQLIFIFDELEAVYENQNEIISSDDLIFILSLTCLGMKKNLKDIVSSNIENSEENKSFILNILKNNKTEKYLIKKRCNLFAKAFNTLYKLNDTEFLFKTPSNEIIQKYFFQKNNYEKINILTLKKILELYISKTLKGI